MNNSTFLRVRLIDVRPLAAGYQFRIIGHSDDLDEARRRLERAVPACALMQDPRTGTWYVRREYKSVVERLFPSFARGAAFADNQVPLF